MSYLLPNQKKKERNPPTKSQCHRNRAMTNPQSSSPSPVKHITRTRLFFNAAAWSPPWSSGTRRYDFISISMHGIPDASGLLRLQLNMQRAVTTEPPIEMLKSYCLKWFGISNKALKTPGNCSPAWKIKYATVPAGVALKAGTNLTFEPIPILATSGFGRSMFQNVDSLGIEQKSRQLWIARFTYTSRGWWFVA